MIAAALAHPADREGFYRHLESLLANNVHWDQVQWQCGTDTTIEPVKSLSRSRLALPSGFLDVCDTVLLHQDADRFMRLHRMAQRLREDRRHWEDVLHEEHRHLLACVRHVRRDMHKMKAFVRFTRVESGGRADDITYVSWFEPDHYIVQVMASFFVRRFANMHWAILTPLGSLHWDGRLHFGPAADRREAPAADAGEALWLTYYSHIFNPSRVKEQAMRREMPVKYWKNLPEAALIPGLMAKAQARSLEMIAHREQGTRTGSRPGMPAPSGDAFSDLRQQLRRCDRCECAARATQAVPGEGSTHARLMIVGEQPGDREDLEGRPFVGPAGELIRAALTAANVAHGEVYITNAVKHFRYEMRGKRRIHKTPLQQDILACAHWLQQEYELIAPERVLLLGRTAITAATQCWGAAVEGEWRTPQGAPIHVVAHPAALLRAGERLGSAGYLRWAAQISEVVNADVPVNTRVTSLMPAGAP